MSYAARISSRPIHSLRPSNTSKCICSVFLFQANNSSNSTFLGERNKETWHECYLPPADADADTTYLDAVSMMPISRAILSCGSSEASFGGLDHPSPMTDDEEEPSAELTSVKRQRSEEFHSRFGSPPPPKRLCTGDDDPMDSDSDEDIPLAQVVEKNRSASSISRYRLRTVVTNYDPANTRNKKFPCFRMSKPERFAWTEEARSEAANNSYAPKTFEEFKLRVWFSYHYSTISILICFLVGEPAFERLSSVYQGLCSARS